MISVKCLWKISNGVGQEKHFKLIKYDKVFEGQAHLPLHSFHKPIKHQLRDLWLELKELMPYKDLHFPPITCQSIKKIPAVTGK